DEDPGDQRLRRDVAAQQLDRLRVRRRVAVRTLQLRRLHRFGIGNVGFRRNGTQRFLDTGGLFGLAHAPRHNTPKTKPRTCSQARGWVRPREPGERMDKAVGYGFFFFLASSSAFFFAASSAAFFLSASAFAFSASAFAFSCAAFCLSASAFALSASAFAFSCAAFFLSASALAFSASAFFFSSAAFSFSASASSFSASPFSFSSSS